MIVCSTMARWERVLKYGLVFFAFLWFIISQASDLAFLHSLVVPRLLEFEIVSLIVGVLSETISQISLTAVVGVVAAGTICIVSIGYYKYGSLSRFTLKVIVWIRNLYKKIVRWIREIGGDDEEILIVGRILEGDFAWKMEYDSHGQMNIKHRECPRCGLEVVERGLRNDIVYGVNSSFNPSDKSQNAASEAWHDVTGKEKVEDQGETLALTCPDCNFSIPGDKEIMEGKDAAISRFRTHIDNMKKSNPKRNPFSSYEKQARKESVDIPTPGDVWDVYVRESDDDDILPVSGKLTNIPNDVEEDVGGITV